MSSAGRATRPGVRRTGNEPRRRASCRLQGRAWPSRRRPRRHLTRKRRLRRRDGSRRRPQRPAGTARRAPRGPRRSSQDPRAQPAAGSARDDEPADVLPPRTSPTRLLIRRNGPGARTSRAAQRRQRRDRSHLDCAGRARAGQRPLGRHDGHRPGTDLAPTWRYRFRVAGSSSAATAATDTSFFYADHVFPIRGRHNLGYGPTNSFGGGGRRTHNGQDMFARCGSSWRIRSRPTPNNRPTAPSVNG